MVQKKSHSESSGGPVACSLDIIGDHWTLLIVRDLMFLGLHEYKEMLAGSEGISSNILIASQIYPQDRKRKFYYLTDMGKGLVYMMVHLIRWSEQYLSEYIDIPPEKKQLIVNDPNRFIELTLQQMNEWEQAHVNVN
jgi:DNA-binding HxlR family transcriptional regulator